MFFCSVRLQSPERIDQSVASQCINTDHDDAIIAAGVNTSEGVSAILVVKSLITLTPSGVLTPAAIAYHGHG